MANNQVKWPVANESLNADGLDGGAKTLRTKLTSGNKGITEDVSPAAPLSTLDETMVKILKELKKMNFQLMLMNDIKIGSAEIDNG
jgi:hypothetical protein